MTNVRISEKYLGSVGLFFLEKRSSSNIGGRSRDRRAPGGGAGLGKL